MKKEMMCMVLLMLGVASACVEPPAASSNGTSSVQDMSATGDMSALDMSGADIFADMDNAQDMEDLAPDLGPDDMQPESACATPCEIDQVCDEEAGACVACLTDNDCEGELVCAPGTNTCVTCFDDTQCSAPGAPRCEPESMACVECLGDGDCTRQDATSCELESKTCVECLTNAECMSPQASKCDEGNACSSCMIDDDCKHLGLERCEAGSCYECRPDTEDEDCNGNACDPKTFTCTQTPLGTLDSCQPCLSDSECGQNQGCVELTFGNVTQGYCLVDGVAAGGCPVPYVVPHNGVTSRSGMTSDWCGINDQVTSCVAVRQRTKDYLSCASSTICGLAGEDDAFCVDEGIGGMVCTYACTQDRQCDQTLEECRDVAGDGVPAKVCTPL